jgi:glyoxalase family protein
MNKDIFGIHHVTAITSDPQRNIDFYTGILGLRFVKLTVNQDDPTSYHLYFGDELGRPGTILTFFHWPDIPKGHRGTGQVIATAFLVPEFYRLLEE